MTNEREHHVTGLTCLHCGAPSTNGTVLCKRCGTTTKVALENVGSYHADLLSLGGAPLVMVRRKSGVSDPTGTAVTSWPKDLARDDDADLAAADTKVMLVGWTRALVGDRPMLIMPRDTVSSLTTFLAGHMGSIATLEWAGEMARDSLEFEQRLRRIIDRSKGRWFAGICSAELEAERQHNEHSCLCSCHTGTDQPCDIEGGCAPEVKTIPAAYCTRDLYAQPGMAYVRCPSCRTQWRVSERRHILLEAARETLLPVSVIARAAIALLDGEPSQAKLDARLRQWVKRGRLEDYGVRVLDGRPRRVYRLGDVIDTLTREVSGTKR